MLLAHSPGVDSDDEGLSLVLQHSDDRHGGFCIGSVFSVCGVQQYDTYTCCLNDMSQVATFIHRLFVLNANP